MLEIRLRFSFFFFFFLTFLSLFSLILCLIGLTETEDSAIINNEDTEES